jgi:ABC-type antimicrobial peptide transport system permease subunit
MEGKGPEGLLSSGVVPILVNDALRYNIGLSVGDRLHIGTMETPLGGKTYSIDVVVVGIISYLPGGRSTIGYGVYQDPDPNLDLQDTDEYEGMYMDIGKLPANFSASVMRSYLVDIGGDEDKMIDSINGMAWNGTSHLVLSRSDETKRIREDTAFKSIEMLLDMEYAFVIVAVTAGVLLFMIVSTASRRREFAELIARGCTRGHVLRLVLTEGAVVLAAGLVLGTIIGMVIAFSFQHLYTENLFQNLPSVGGDSDNGRTVDLGNSIVFPPTILLLHVLTVISVLGASLLTSWLASKVDIASSLRLRTS